MAFVVHVQSLVGLKTTTKLSTLSKTELVLHLQGRQQVAGFSQACPGSVQLLQQLVLRLLQCADLSLGSPDVLLPPLNVLLQPSHLWVGQTAIRVGGGGGLGGVETHR